MGSTGEKLSLEVCEQQRRRPACASAKSDQRLCCSLFGKYDIYTCFKRKIVLASLCILAAWSESKFLKNPKDRF